MMHRPALPVLLVAALALGGCAALGGGPALDAYELRAPAEGPVARRSLARDLVVELPEAGPSVDIDRILVRPNPLQAQYLPGARWADPAPVLLQGLMLRGLEDAGGLRYVGRRPLGSSGDFALISEITDFQAELGANGDPVMVRLRVTARLVREDDASIRASRSFEVLAPAASTDTLDVIEGFEAGAAQLVPQVTEWVLRSLGVGLAASG